MDPQEPCHTAHVMGGWIIDMADLEAAHAAIARCKAETHAEIEVRHTLWGVQVRTDSDSAADFLKTHYSHAPVALAA